MYKDKGILIKIFDVEYFECKSEKISRKHKKILNLMRGDDTMQLEVKSMLLQFNVENFKSIGSEVTLDMTASGLSEHKDFLIEEKGVNILPVATIYGANASGKTNVLKAFQEFRRLIVFSRYYSNKNESNDPIIPFLFDDILSDENTTFSVFLVSGDRKKEYNYGCSLKDGIVYEEWLQERTFSKNNTIWKKVLEREKQSFAYGEQKKYKKLSGYDDLIQNNMLAVSFLGSKEIKGIDAFKEVYNWASLGFYESVVGGIDIQNALKQYMVFEKYDIHAFEETKKFIRSIDPCIEDIEIESQKDTQNQDVYKAYTYHKGRKFDLMNESDGTKKIFALYLQIFLVLTLGGILIVDELDAQLHPLILRKIVRMFHDKEYNKGAGQLIFSSHNLLLLNKDEMRRDEIWFVEKDVDGFTTISSLSDYKVNESCIRSDLDYGKNYLAGRFGAIPFLNEGV